MEQNEDFVRELSTAIQPYRRLLAAFVTGQMSADDFETRYFDVYLNDQSVGGSDEVFDVVDGFFADVDAYVSNPHIRDLAAGDLGPEELRDRARELLRRAGG